MYTNAAQVYAPGPSGRSETLVAPPTGIGNQFAIACFICGTWKRPWRMRAAYVIPDNVGRSATGLGYLFELAYNHFELLELTYPLHVPFPPVAPQSRRLRRCCMTSSPRSRGSSPGHPATYPLAAARSAPNSVAPRLTPTSLTVASRRATYVGRDHSPVRVGCPVARTECRSAPLVVVFE